VIKVPDARPSRLGLVGMLLPTAMIAANGQPVSVFPDLGNPRLLLTGYTGDLGLDSGVPRSVYELDTSRMHQLGSSQGQPFRVMLAPGQSVPLPGGVGSVTFDGVRRYAALDIRHDPSDGWALAAALLTLAGLVASLFVRRRRVWVRTSGEGATTVVEAAGLARREDPGLAVEVAAVLDSMLAAIGPPVSEQHDEQDDEHAGQQTVPGESEPDDMGREDTERPVEGRPAQMVRE